MENLRMVIVPKTQNKGYTDENTLSNALLTKPDVLSTSITYLGGKESDKFPLTFLTEGQTGGKDFKTAAEVQDARFTWPVARRPKKSDIVVGFETVSNGLYGQYNTDIIVYFKSMFLIEQHPIVSKNGYKARIARKPEKVGTNKYKYVLKVMSSIDSAYIPASEFAAGSKWGMIGNGLVSESDSYGNRSTTETPGRMENQLSFYRKSFHIAGNTSNKIVEIYLPAANNKTTMVWGEFEYWTHQLKWREMSEEHFWESEYNRNSNGEILLMDEESGKPIPTSAGMFQQVNHEDTYGQLSFKKINNIIGDVAYGATDTDQMQIVLYCGKGFMRDFDEALKTQANTLTQITGDKFVQGYGRNLTLTGFFRQFEHVDGHTVILKHLPLLEFGGRAEVAERHPVSGLPMTSHEAYFIDQSTYDGQRNIKMVSQKGRGFLAGSINGITPLYGESKFGYGDMQGGGLFGRRISTEQDTNSVHYFGSKAVNMFRNEHCFKLKCTLS